MRGCRCENGSLDAERVHPLSQHLRSLLSPYKCLAKEDSARVGVEVAVPQKQGL